MIIEDIILGFRNPEGVTLFHPFGVGTLGIYCFSIIIPSLRDLATGERILDIKMGR